jgi:rRNA maturation RNase YbeY
MKNISFINETKYKIQRLIFEKIFQWLKDDNVFCPNAECCLKLSNDDQIQNLNTKYRGVNKTTDVLVFPCEILNVSFIGDIIINLEQAKKQCKFESIDNEIYYLFIHGLLHLSGMQHTQKENKTKMVSAEKKYFEKLLYYLSNKG